MFGVSLADGGVFVDFQKHSPLGHAAVGGDSVSWRTPNRRWNGTGWNGTDADRTKPHSKGVKVQPGQQARVQKLFYHLPMSFERL